MSGLNAPLAGVTVVDASSSYAGPTLTMLLGDMGAEVIKIERPRTGDDTRAWGPPFVGEQSAWFVSANRNKRSICIDLKQPEGREVLHALLARANVFVESMNPKKLEQLELDPASLTARHPSLIYCALSGFGMDGPDRELPGYDLIAQARSGLMSVTGEPGRSPQRVSTALSDIATAFVGAFAVASALNRQQRDGTGAVLDVALLDVDLALMAPRIAAFLAGEPEPQPSGATDSVLAIYQGFPTADRTLAIAIGNDVIWRRFCTAVGLSELAEDARYRTNEQRREHRAHLVDRIEHVLAQQPMDHWLRILTTAGVPCAPIQYLSEVVTDPQVVGRGSLQQLTFYDGAALETVTHPWRLVGEVGDDPTPPPSLGADGLDLLGDLGYGADTIARLTETGAVWQPHA